MITQVEYYRATKNIEEGKKLFNQSIPNGFINFVGFDKDFIYFKAIAKLSQITPEQMDDLKHKSRFLVENELTSIGLFQADLKLGIFDL